MTDSKITLYIKNNSGKSLPMTFSRNEKIGAIKERILEVEGVPEHGYRLIFAANDLDSEKTIHEYNLQDGSTLHMIGRLRGG